MRLEASLDKRFGTFRLQADFTLDCRRCGIFGPSGSGKSTLVHMLAGLLKPDRGTIRLDSTPVFDADKGIDIPPEQRRIGVVFQQSHLFPHMSVKANLFYGWRRTPPAGRRIDPPALIRALNLDHLLRRGVTSLSGGEQRRVALGRAILACPRLILMDEPLTGLDDELKGQIMPYLKKVFAEFEVPLLFISHSLEEMCMMTDNILIFDNGCLREQVTSEALKARCTASICGGDYARLSDLPGTGTAS
ncbi:MAG: ATP-binding cassette domain-containing protein [Desulfobulbaceae bacterium]